jgi:DNA polymerase III epsilon subunit-like protein
MCQKSIRVAILDTETTGLLPSDEPISVPARHDALADCRALAAALFQYSGKTVRSRTYFAALLAKRTRTHTHEYDAQPRQPRSIVVGSERYIEVGSQLEEPTNFLPWIFFGLVPQWAEDALRDAGVAS